MASFDDEPRKAPGTHVIGQDLSTLSLEDLAERVRMLQDEVARLETARAAKSASMTAADAFFRKRD